MLEKSAIMICRIEITFLYANQNHLKVIKSSRTREDILISYLSICFFVFLFFYLFFYFALFFFCFLPLESSTLTRNKTIYQTALKSQNSCRAQLPTSIHL